MNELVVQQGPTVVYAYNVLDKRERKVFRGRHGQSIRQLRPKTSSPVLVMWNANLVLPEDEGYVPMPSDHITFVHLPQGGGNVSEQILGVILVVAGVLTANPYLVAAGVGLVVSGLVPIPKTPNSPLSSAQSASPTYNIQVSGNSARVGQSIPVMYGRHIMLPDFASQPYVEYDASGNQYYYAIMCLGQLVQGKYNLEAIQIDDTDLSHFVDVHYLIGNSFVSPDTDLLGPFEDPYGLVNPSVVTNTAVANNVMVYGTVIGPFVVCGPGLQVNRIGIDIVCPKGLYYANNSGALDPVTVHWQLEARKVDDYNLPIGGWVRLGSESLTGANATPVRRSYKYTVDYGRYEVRAQRLEAENTDSRYAEEIQWAGLRAYLTAASPMEPSATYLQLRIKADSQLSGLSQRQVSVIIQRWLPTWNPTDGWLPDSYTRSPAWAAVDVYRNTDYGGSVSDDRIDLLSYYELDLICQARGDTCNIMIDSRTVLWQAAQTVLSTCRAHPLMRGSVFTVVRDQQQELPVAMFNMRNIVKGSFKMSFNMVNEDTTDGIETEFFNELTWAVDYVREPLPGFTESVDPTSVTLVGITSRVQAQRETLYMVADAAYRRTSISFDTELEGYLPCFGDLIAVSHDVPSWGQSGEFEQWDGTDAQCTEDLTWASGPNYVLIVNWQGDPLGPYLVTPGDGPRTMRFVDLDVTLIYVGSDRDRTRYVFGPGSAYTTLCKVVAITPGQDNAVTIAAVVEDNRVHAADNELLPGTPDGGTGTVPGGGRPFILSGDPNSPDYDSSSDADHVAYGFLAEDDFTVGTSHDPGYYLS